MSDEKLEENTEIKKIAKIGESGAEELVAKPAIDVAEIRTDKVLNSFHLDSNVVANIVVDHFSNVSAYIVVDQPLSINPPKPVKRCEYTPKEVKRFDYSELVEEMLVEPDDVSINEFENKINEDKMIDAISKIISDNDVKRTLRRLKIKTAVLDFVSRYIRSRAFVSFCCSLMNKILPTSDSKSIVSDAISNCLIEYNNLNLFDSGCFQECHELLLDGLMKYKNIIDKRSDDIMLDKDFFAIRNLTYRNKRRRNSKKR